MDMETEGKLGCKLTECFSDKGKIAFQVSWRTALCLALDIGNFGGIAAIRRWGETPPQLSAIIVNLALTVGFGLFPLIHLRRYMAFYERGIVYGKRAYLWSELGSAGWRDHTTGGIFHSLIMETNKKNFDVTYLANPKKQYNRAYMSH